MRGYFNFYMNSRSYTWLFGTGKFEINPSELFHFKTKWKEHSNLYFYRVSWPIDLSPFEWNFDLDKSGQKFHHSLKEHHKISNIPKFRCEML
jgi:hypothetical protein